MTPAEQLCLACGLCCDGTLFDNVRLAPRDDAPRLRALGLPVAVTRGHTPVAYFRQPCAGLCANRTCRVYADRPTQCRDFECGVFQAARAGQLSHASALRWVRQARRRAERIRALLRALGDTDEHRPLSERFRRTTRRLETDGADPAAAATLAELGLAMHRFHLLAHEKFYTKADAK
ncbi:MAG: hypothetical protein RLZZ15_3020 [Verrucomicrobiota bacterium]